MALKFKDYNGYGTYDRAYNHLASKDTETQHRYDNGVLSSQFLDNQSKFIQNVNSDPWATAGMLLGAIAANIKQGYDERGAQKTADSIFNSLGLAEQQPTQYIQNGQAISVNNPNGDVQQQPSVLDQLGQGVTIGNQLVQGMAQDQKNSIISNAMNKWGADPNANQTALALQQATDGVNANFALGTGPTRSQMINTALEKGRQAGLNQYQLDALTQRVGEAYDARYSNDLKQYNQDMTGQISSALQNRDYNKVGGLLTNMTAINPTLAASLGNIVKIRMDNDLRQQTINNAVDNAAKKLGINGSAEHYVGGRRAQYTKDHLRLLTDMATDSSEGYNSPSYIIPGKTIREAMPIVQAGMFDVQGTPVSQAVDMGAAEVMKHANKDGKISEQDLFNVLNAKTDLLDDALYNSALTNRLKEIGAIPQDYGGTAYGWRKEYIKEQEQKALAEKAAKQKAKAEAEKALVQRRLEAHKMGLRGSEV